MAGVGGRNRRVRDAPVRKQSGSFLARLQEPDTVSPSDFLLDVLNQRAMHIPEGESEPQPVQVTFEQRFEAAIRLLPHELPKLATIEADVRMGNLSHEDALQQLEEAAGMRPVDVEDVQYQEVSNDAISEGDN
jgi:hypothetical protein